MSLTEFPKSISCLCCSTLSKENQLSNRNDFSKNDSNLITDVPKISVQSLQFRNSVELSATSELQTKIKELKLKLQKSENEREDFKRRLEDSMEEKDRCYRRLEVISAAHESRITEMHCVIAELSKKLRNKQDNIILEENEPDGSEISYQEGSIYNSELNLTNPDAECQTEPIEGDFNNSFGEDIKEDFHNDTVAKTQVEALQEEVFHLKAQIALLESQLASNNEESSPEAQRNERNILCKNDEILNAENEEQNDLTGDYIDEPLLEREANKFIEHPLLKDRESEEFYKTDDNEITGQIIEKTPIKDIFLNIIEDSACNNNGSAIKQSATKYLSNYNNIIKSQEILIPKMAERVKLRRTIEEKHITGSDSLNTNLNRTELVEHLVSSITQDNNSISNLVEPSQLHTEFERLQRRIEHFKTRNSVLSLTLYEVKEHCDYLYLLCGKYESNAVALQCALNCSDRAIEAYDVMLALLESKLAILKEKTSAAEESRQAVETVARHLLDRLESEKNLAENSLGPWQNAFCINNSQPIEPWTAEDDNRLRTHVSKLKGRRSTVQNTIVNLESPFSSYYEKIRTAIETDKDVQPDNSKMDLEMAVLMQELLSLREDIIEAKQKRSEAEKEKQMAVEKIYLLQETLQQLQTQLTDSETLFNLTSKDRSSFSEADHAALIERQLVEALTRESELKNRIQSLIGSVAVSKKYDQVQTNLVELQKINFNLSQSLEQSKKKYQSKIKRLEQKILEMNLELGQLHNKPNDIVPETTL
ncbi:colorectal mutant cancer protein isoform X2 [Condylostylus longicornis]|uniref:colorectal mutant cancer protein isoform X2 n=1 Tax=Condylostylus longicornis TaxID=2530218 RepID=UPI00244E0EB5|nr:colorectal mutant cancer protein isoform X2 [Condylostylus longicornis]